MRRKTHKKQVVTVFEETYLLDLKKDYAGNNNSKIPDIFEYLCQHYGKVRGNDLFASKEKYQNNGIQLTLYKPCLRRLKIKLSTLS